MRFILNIFVFFSSLYFSKLLLRRKAIQAAVIPITMNVWSFCSANCCCAFLRSSMCGNDRTPRWCSLGCATVCYCTATKGSPIWSCLRERTLWTCWSAVFPIRIECWGKAMCCSLCCTAYNGIQNTNLVRMKGLLRWGLLYASSVDNTFPLQSLVDSDKWQCISINRSPPKWGIYGRWVINPLSLLCGKRF